MFCFAFIAAFYLFFRANVHCALACRKLLSIVYVCDSRKELESTTYADFSSDSDSGQNVRLRPTLTRFSTLNSQPCYISTTAIRYWLSDAISR